MAPPLTPKQYPPETAFDEKIEIKVGAAERKSFIMHKGVLRFYSGFFDRALASDTWVEGKTGVVELEAEDVVTFERFQYWAYSRRFCSPAKTATQDVSTSDIIKLWLFGDRRDVPLLQNEAINLLRAKTVATWEVPSNEVNHIYTSTTTGSTLRKFIIDIVGKASALEMHDGVMLDKFFNKEALIDLVKVVWSPSKVAWSKEDVRKLNMCQYHVHEEGVTCKASGGR